MSDSKTYVFGSDAAGGNLATILPALMQQRGIDPSMLALMGGGGFGGFGNNGLFDILLLFILFGTANGNGFGFGGNRNGGALQNDANTACIMQAIERNGFTVQSLATALNSSTADIIAAINAVSGSICNLGNQLGQSTNQIITAIMQGNNAIQSQICSCCCDLKSVIASLNTGMERGFSSLAFETQKQTCSIEKSIADSTAQILAGQRAAEMREMQNKIDALQEEKQTYKLGTMMAQNNAPLIQAIAALQSDIDKVKCKLPDTTTVPYSPIVGVPNCVAAQYGLGWNIGGNSLWG